MPLGGSDPKAGGRGELRDRGACGGVFFEEAHGHILRFSIRTARREISARAGAVGECGGGVGARGQRGRGEKAVHQTLLRRRLAGAIPVSRDAQHLGRRRSHGGPHSLYDGRREPARKSRARVKVALNILIASVLLALAGCKVGPDYHSPETKMPAQWASSPTNADAASSTNPAVVAATWWETFHDAELNSLIARAVSSNLDLRMANARVREARAARGIVAGRLWPTADASGSYQRERISQRGFPTFPPGIKLEDNVYQAGFDSTWELDVFGGQRRSVEAANAEIGAAEESRRSVMVSLLGEVARNYVEARGFQERLAIAQDNIKAQREAVRLTRDRFNSGLTSELDVQQATVLLANTEAEVPTFETGFRVACYSLAVLTAQEPGALVSELSEAKPVPPVPPVVPAGLPSELLQRRPDIRRAERELAATTARIGAAKADLFPKFSLTGSVGLQSVTASDWFSGASRFWSAGPTAQWRIFDAGQI